MVWLTAWLKGWSELSGYDDVPGYRGLSWTARKKLDHLALWRGLCSEGFWRALFIVIVFCMIARILTWHWDLSGWPRDLLRSVPIMLALPWLAAARKRHIQSLLNASRPPSEMR